MASQVLAVPAAAGVTFDEAVRQWTVKLQADKKSTDTLARYPKLIRQMAFRCGYVSVSQAATDGIMRWLSETAVDEEWSGKSHNNALYALNSFFRFAGLNGWTVAHPTKDITRAEEEPGDGMRPFTMAEQDAILAAAPERHVTYQFARETGLRKGNQFANPNCKSIRCGMVHIPEKRLVLPPKFLKNRKMIVLPLTDDLAERLGRIIHGQAPDAPVFPEWCDNRTLFDDMERAMVPRVNDRGEPAAWHSWRKGFLSALAEAGVHPKTAQELAGHSSILLTMRHYTRVSDATKRAAVEKIFTHANPAESSTSSTSEKKNAPTGSNGVAETGVNGTMNPSASQVSRAMTQITTQSHDLARGCRPESCTGTEKPVLALGSTAPRRTVRDTSPMDAPSDAMGYATPWTGPLTGFSAPLWVAPMGFDPAPLTAPAPAGGTECHGSSFGIKTPTAPSDYASSKREAASPFAEPTGAATDKKLSQWSRATGDSTGKSCPESSTESRPTHAGESRSPNDLPPPPGKRRADEAGQRVPGGTAHLPGGADSDARQIVGGREPIQTADVAAKAESHNARSKGEAAHPLQRGGLVSPSRCDSDPGAFTPPFAAPRRETQDGDKTPLDVAAHRDEHSAGPGSRSDQRIGPVDVRHDPVDSSGGVLVRPANQQSPTGSGDGPLTPSEALDAYRTLRDLLKQAGVVRAMKIGGAVIVGLATVAGLAATSRAPERQVASCVGDAP